MGTPAPIDDAVLDAAAAVLGREGLAGLSLSAVADEVGISRVTLHRHGVRRGDLLAGVARRTSDDLRASLWPVLTDAGDAASRLATALGVLCQVIDRHAGVLGALYHVPDRPDPARGGRRAGFDFIEPFERLLLDGAIDGSLRSVDAAEDAELVVNAVTWTYLHLRTAHGWPEERAAARTIGLATAHLAPTVEPPYPARVDAEPGSEPP